MTDRRFVTLAEIISFAVQREIDAATGYATIAALAATPALHQLADDLRRQEESHRRLLEGLSGTDLLEPGTSSVPDFHIVDTLADEKLSEDMSLQDMLIFAAKKEAQAVALYESLARMAGSPEHERIFQFLAGQEREHKLKIEAEYEKQVLPEN